MLFQARKKLSFCYYWLAIRSLTDDRLRRILFSHRFFGTR